MEMTFSIGFNKAAQRYIDMGQSSDHPQAVTDLLRDALFNSFYVFSPISRLEELPPSKKNRRFSVTLNDKLSAAIRSEGKAPEDVLKEVIGGYLRRNCKIWDQEGCKFTPPLLC